MLLTEPMAPSRDGWRAELSLSYANQDGHTFISSRKHFGPLLVQRAFYPEGPAVAHSLLIHPPGGVVGGDELNVSLRTGPGAHALVTAPGALKLYSHPERTAQISQVFHLERESRLEWLPQETIAFSGSRVRQHTQIDLEEGALFLGWDLVCLGRPACAERFDHGELEATLCIRARGDVLLEERTWIRGGERALNAAWGYRGLPVFATLIAARTQTAGVDLDSILEQVRAILTPDPAASGNGHTSDNHSSQVSASGATLLYGPTPQNRNAALLVVRALCPSTQVARQLFRNVWNTLRPHWFGRPAVAPRVWST
jgi:urease accessory protein